ncbi:hypothetical protein BD779DRAFT_1672490 [Infundibulicybe gibba]|nr:hypothetical protein BD779DRAFT_1672490 [Infundibulicybe gibba]
MWPAWTGQGQSANDSDGDSNLSEGGLRLRGCVIRFVFPSLQLSSEWSPPSPPPHKHPSSSPASSRTCSLENGSQRPVARAGVGLPTASRAAQQERDRELDEWRIEDKARRKRTRAAMSAVKALDRDETQEGQEKRKQAFKRAQEALVEEIKNGKPPHPHLALPSC